MDGFSLTLYLKQLILMIGFLDPTISITDVYLLEPPRIEFVTPEYFVNNICTCECRENGIYGRFYLDSDGSPVILTTSPDGETIPPVNLLYDALMVHELVHFIKDYSLNPEIRQFGSLPPDMSEEEIREYKMVSERHAYEIQNKFLEFHNGPTFDIDKQILWSTNMGTGGCGGEGRLGTTPVLIIVAD